MRHCPVTIDTLELRLIVLLASMTILGVARNAVRNAIRVIGVVNACIHLLTGVTVCYGVHPPHLLLSLLLVVSLLT